jgi:hypothetical protein
MLHVSMNCTSSVERGRSSGRHNKKVSRSILLRPSLKSSLFFYRIHPDSATNLSRQPGLLLSNLSSKFSREIPKNLKDITLLISSIHSTYLELTVSAAHPYIVSFAKFKFDPFVILLSLSLCLCNNARIH